MTEDEIIEMAQQAHFNSKTWIDIYNDGITTGDVRGYLQAFANLVAAKVTQQEQDRCCAIVFGQCETRQRSAKNC
jgi:predicted DNA-binding protein (MmcQ/YjbR family)